MMMQQSSEEIDRLTASVQLNDRQAAIRDIINAFNNAQSHFTLRIGDFYFHDGISKKSLYLDGTIVTKYRNLRYNTPVELWIQETHPYTPPICYVKPSPNMYISFICSHVESDGRIVHPYLQSWIPSISSSTMLIDQLSKAFTTNPPLYSNPPSSQQSSNTNQDSPQVNQLTSSDTRNNRCHICVEREIDCVLLERGHLVSCSHCAIHFRACPFCRSTITRIKRIFRT